MNPSRALLTFHLATLATVATVALYGPEISTEAGFGLLPHLNVSFLLFCNVGVSCETCIQAQLYMEPIHCSGKLKIKFRELATNRQKTFIFERKSNTSVKWSALTKKSTVVKTQELFNTSFHEIVYECFMAISRNKILIQVSCDRNMLIRTNVIVKDLRTVPKFSVLVDPTTHKLSVSVEKGPIVKARLCYRRSDVCSILSPPVEVMINTSESNSVNVSVPIILPCLCLQVYYSYDDAPREMFCPFKDRRLDEFPEIWSTSQLKLLGTSTLKWMPVCSYPPLKPSATLCWHIYGNLAHCMDVPNSTLQGKKLEYNLSAVDQHQQMCVKMSLNNSHSIHCPFQSLSIHQWDVIDVVPSSLHFYVYITSSMPAAFTGQLCFRVEDECAPSGDVHTVVMTANRQTELRLPLPPLLNHLCVQVWRSEPFLHGRRFICPSYTHRRCGLILGISLAFLVTLAVLGYLTFCSIRQKVSAWECATPPVLLVNSSDEAAHLAAVCSLASGLQRELRASVRLALWDHSSSQDSLACLGPIPWLHAQCRAVQQEQGVVLITWSSVASEAFVQWRGEREKKLRRKLKARENCTKTDEQKEANKTYGTSGQADGHMEEMNSVTSSVFTATLSCLQAALQQGDSQDHCFSILCFQGLSSCAEIPTDLQHVPRYCLPQDLSQLLWRISHGVKRGNCSSMLFTLVECWMIWRVARRLRACVPNRDPHWLSAGLPWLMWTRSQKMNKEKENSLFLPK
ncbi:interleukin-17 receptor E isoform X2 [Denticeps clupeoides]|uniref:interleukin-17 receptor E isoform X2 n=1 Tax=Denticeps clupeoides TaxID=299321 RepID=UPI0010A39F8A|nr:interleukin-17 receptor E isoform X2 [Denticeps clupeoides]